MKAKRKTEVINRTPLTAWNYLLEHGGIETAERDEGLEQRIHQRLNPEAKSLHDALKEATMERFAIAFFEAIHPFVEMFRDILVFFEKANATHGEGQWVLQLGDINLDLDHFRQWIEKWRDTGKVVHKVAGIDWKTVWELLSILRRNRRVEFALQNSFSKAPLDISLDVQAWVAAFNRGEYIPLPISLVPPNCPEALEKAALIAQVALSRIVELGYTREKLMKVYHKQHALMDRSDAFNFLSIAQNETDFWLRSFIVALSAAAEHMSRQELQNIEAEFDSLLAPFPLKPFQITVSIRDLESVLSLPIWKKRHELYSVWIATEIIRALDKHQIEIHHDKGHIPFAFRETILATVHSSPGPFTIVCERRSPLINPRGKGRKAGVQPDHALWTSDAGEQICRLVVEVKHYKSSAKAKFIDLFEDYARALPEAEVYLVSHGPVGNAVYDLQRELRDRCHAIGYLMASNTEARRELQKAVRDCVGEPIEIWPGTSTPPDTGRIMMFDVSGSMLTALRSREMAAFVRKLVAVEKPYELVAVDTKIIRSWPATEPAFKELLQQDGGDTDLSIPVQTLFERSNYIIIITDDDGIRTLSELATEVHPAEADAPTSIRVRFLRRN